MLLLTTTIMTSVLAISTSMRASTSSSLLGVSAFVVPNHNHHHQKQVAASWSPSFLWTTTPVSTATTTTCLFAEDDKNKAEQTTAEQQQQQQQDEETTTAAGDDDVSSATDILNSPAFLRRKLEVLKSDVERLEEELAAANGRVDVAKEEWGPQLEQLSNEYSNIRERMSNQNEQGDSKAIVTVVKEMVDVLDNFDRAYGVIKPQTEVEEAVQAEFKAAYQGILDTFEELGVMQVKTVGTEFDYDLHQAVMQMPGTEYEEGIVCQEFQKGFIMGEETLIRPALVAVAS